MDIRIITDFLRKHKAIFIFLALFLGNFFLGAESLFANEGDTGISDENLEKAVGILNGIITLAAALMGMVTGFITMFLYPGWTNGTLFGLQEYLKTIWILISNVVYFVFAFILIAIAFMNIIGKGEGTWELKQAMPKFIVGVLIVPFSWFFVQFILSISAILTVGVLTLPYDSFSDHDLFVQALEDREFANQEICKDIIISFNGDFGKYPTSSISTEENELDENIQCRTDVGDGGGNGKVTIRELITGQDESGTASADGAGLQNSVFGIISIYSYGILKIDQLDTLNDGDLESIKTGADLVFKVVFDVLFVIVYLILMVALLLALFVRGVRLWIYMMLSPAFGLLYFFGSEGIGDSDNKFSIKEFISLALVPVYVSAALAFGLVFMLVAAKGITLENPDEPDMLSAGGFTITMIGAQGGSENEETSGSLIGKMIVQIFGIVILWIAVISALKTSETTKQITAPIAEFGKSVGQLAAKSPTYAPILPTSLGGSAAGLQQLGSSVTSGIDSHFKGQGTERGAEFAEQFTGGGTAASSLRNSTEPYREAVVSGDRGAIESTLNQLKGQSLDSLRQDRQLRTQFTENLERIFGKNDDGDNVITAANINAINGATTEATLSLAIARAFQEASTNGLDSGRRSAIAAGFGAPGSMNEAEVRRIMGGGTPTPPTGGGNGNQTPQQPANYTAPTGPVNITVNGTAAPIDTNNITLFDNGGARSATIDSSIEASLQGVTKDALVTAGYSEVDAEAIIAAL